MKIPLKLFLLPVLMLTGIIQLTAQEQYSSFQTMSQKLSAMSREYPSLTTVKSLVKTDGGKEIFVITIGTGDKDNKPGIAVVGGIEGSHILGKELSLGFASSLLKESGSAEIKELLEKVTFYIFPDVSPDATEQYFSGLKYERNINSRPTDDDRDFKTGEDPFEDLNKDGFITMIRVADPSGTYIESKEDKRIMVPADLALGQTGKYIVVTEGIDNDKDGKFNEDGEGGVSFNRNFTFNYEEYGLNAGLHPVSEPESKAVADFLYDRFNIYTVFSFGPQDNLGQPMKASERPSTQPSVQPLALPGQGGPGSMGGGRPQGDRKITAILKSDETINKLVSDKYHDITGVKGAPTSKTTPGNFMEWAYFHYGRYSFSTPAWWFATDKGKSPEAAFLKFAEKKKMKDVFVPWTEINDSDFPGKKAEAGGLKPFALINPPADTLGVLINKNYKFITAVAAMHPELEFLDIQTENAGENIYRITLKLHNKGIFATCAEAGDNNSWTRIMRLSLETGKSQSVLSGQKVQRVKRLEGDQSSEFSWLIMGKGAVKITAGAVNTGTVSANIELK
jgi:hypothetical protein